MTVVSIRCAAFTHLLETDLLLCVSGYDGPGPASPGGASGHHSNPTACACHCLRLPLTGGRLKAGSADIRT